MSNINLPNQKKQYQKLNKRLARYVGMVQAIYDSLNLEASKIAVDTDYPKHEDGEFHFSDYPETKKRVDDLQSEFVNNISSVIFQGTSREWKESNIMQDLLADKVYKRYLRDRDGEKREVYYKTNNDALKAFQQRKDRGLNISQKLWNQSKLYKEELETAISTAIERGTDAITLSKKISKYLNDFPSLQKDYTEKFGHASKANDCEYRSIRLARSEINMAYRKAEQLRWQQMDFVVGYEIHLSGSHPKEDICDRLAGKYPKDFVWTGFHPNDLCYKTSILKDEDEFFDLDFEGLSRNEVTDVPDAFKEWVNENEDRIKAAEKHNTLPYFLKDNKEYVEDALKLKHSEQVEKPTATQEKQIVVKSDVKDIHDQMDTSSPTMRGLRESRTDNAQIVDEPQPFHFKSVEEIEKLHGLFSLQGDYFEYLGSPQRYDNSPVAGFDLLAYYNEVSKICRENGIELTDSKIVCIHNKVSVRFYGNKDGEEFSLERDFHKSDISGERAVHHSLFEVPDSLQGKGISKRLFSFLFSQYEQSGIDYVELFANLHVGGYCWAKYGFCAKIEDAKEIFDWAHKRGRITPEEYKKAIDTITNNENQGYVPMQKLANLPFGKKILLGSSWDGMLNLHDKIQMEYVHEYINRKK